MTGQEDRPLVVVITGAVGAGKTATAWALQDYLAEVRIPNAVIDMDYLRSAWPQVTEWNARLGYDNFAAIAVNHQSIGVQTFLVADVVETQEQRRHYEAAVPGAEVVIVRLDVPLDVLEARLRVRETPEDLAWSLARAPELAKIQRTREIGDHVIPIADQSPATVARQLADTLGLALRSRLP